MDAALTELRAGTAVSISAVAKKHQVDRSSLSRRYSCKASTKEDRTESKQLLNIYQEEQLIDYIRKQCELCLPPTARIVSNIAAELAGRQPSKNWCSRFVSRHKDSLDSRYLNTFDFSRHEADTRASYRQYFEIVGKKIVEYGITAENTYNMDEKGFMMGQI